jgi:pyruvate formate lyase activating enzyme
MQGILFDIKRFAVHDGPGIRTTVFFKGCPLHCVWCHNPESINPAIIQVPKTYTMDGHTFTEQETVGWMATVAEVMTELHKEAVFMTTSGGGVTFSGGEPLQQPEFLMALLEACQQAGFHTAVDTCGLAPWPILEAVAARTNLFLYDLKRMDPVHHKQVTGTSNTLILDNLRRLSAMGAPLRIRIPLIPDMTFTETNLTEILAFLATLPQKPQGVDLLPYHNTASHKYDRFGKENILKGVKSLQKTSLGTLKQRFEKAGYEVTIGG